MMKEDKYIENFRILEIRQNVSEDNDYQANLLKEELKKKEVFLLNLISSPGLGKTSTPTKTTNILENEVKVGVMEADIDSDVGAYIISKTRAEIIQLHTGGMCHPDAGMIKRGLEGLEAESIDFAILESVGDLVCPAESDTGASKNAMILSVPEGDDKLLKYPSMFSITDVLLVNKMDIINYFDFNSETCIERVKKLNPNTEIIPISVKTGEGIDRFSE